ncbi:MAG: hypothetical protein HQL31_01790 [Planctomycetes bacterium]|nr:hypothetical protein [Planctomycetota bacterium]
MSSKEIGMTDEGKMQDLFTGIFGKLDEVEQFLSEVRSYERRSQRVALEHRVEVEFRAESKDPIDRGTASVLDISEHGALLGDFEMKNYYLPLRRCVVEIRFEHKELKGIVYEGRPVRLVERGDNILLGLNFINRASDIAKLKGLLKSPVALKKGSAKGSKA